MRVNQRKMGVMLTYVSEAIKILLPVNKCNNIIIGTGDKSTSDLIDEAIEKIREISRS